MPKGKPKHLSNIDLIKAANIAARMANTERNANQLYVKALIEVAEILEAAAAMGKLTEIRAWTKSRAEREGESDE